MTFIFILLPCTYVFMPCKVTLTSFVRVIHILDEDAFEGTRGKVL